MLYVTCKFGFHINTFSMFSMTTPRTRLSLLLLLSLCIVFLALPRSAQAITCTCDIVEDESSSCLEPVPAQPEFCNPINCAPAYQCVEGGASICDVIVTSVTVLKFINGTESFPALCTEAVVNSTLVTIQVFTPVAIAVIKPSFSSIFEVRSCAQQCYLSSLTCSSSLTTQFATSNSSTSMVITKGESTLVTHCRDQNAATNVFGYNANTVDPYVYSYNLCIYEGLYSSKLFPQATTFTNGSSPPKVNPCEVNQIGEIGYAYYYACMCDVPNRRFSLLPTMNLDPQTSSRPELFMSAIAQDRKAAVEEHMDVYMATIKDASSRQMKAEATCDEYPAPAGNKQVCCSFDSGSTFHCLPSFLIVGAQKAGTTALFAYISEHPNFRKNSRGKELHFFDLDIKYNDGLETYLKMQPATKQEEIPLAITGEASPSYMAKHGVCRSIAEVDPTMKIIVMLRNPVERAWSEIQMKVRQDASLRSWIQLLQTHTSSLHHCLKRVAEHPDHAKFRELKYSSKEKKQIRAKLLSGFSECVPSAVSQHTRWSHFVDNMLAGKIMTRSYSKLFKTTGSDKVELNVEAFSGFFQSMAENYIERFPNKELDVLHELEAEIHSIESCLKSSGDDLSRCFTQSVNPADISKDYVWRGMYAKQLKECMTHIPRDNMLIIETNELREAPEQTLGRVFHFLGLEKNRKVASMKEAQLEETIRKSQPGFEELTGWRIHGTEPTKVPAYVRETLSAFYAPHNEELFQLLGHRYEHW